MIKNPLIRRRIIRTGRQINKVKIKTGNKPVIYSHINARNNGRTYRLNYLKANSYFNNGLN
jgi:hypothetical protein